jgi:hypothetical protein
MREHDCPAVANANLKVDESIFLPHLGPQDVSWDHRGSEARKHRPQTLRLVVAARLQHGVTSHAKCGNTVKDRLAIPSLSRNRRINVQRV